MAYMLKWNYKPREPRHWRLEYWIPERRRYALDLTRKFFTVEAAYEVGYQLVNSKQWNDFRVVGVVNSKKGITND